VRAGRLEFLTQFPTLAAEEMRSLVYHPANEQAFRECVLPHGIKGKTHDRARALHRDLLRLRRTDSVLSRLGTNDVNIESCAPTAEIVLIRYRSAHGERLLIANLGADVLSPMNDALYATMPGHHWHMLWSSEDPAYGGGGTTPFGTNGQWLLTGYSAVILAMTREESPAHPSDRK
jgi:maltooligosyltrehalose trehalohydrolase